MNPLAYPFVSQLSRLSVGECPVCCRTVPLRTLVSLIPSPNPGIDVPSAEDFALCEAEIGLALPTDFKGLLSTYGAGRFIDYLFAYPLSGADMTIRHNRQLLDGHASSREQFPEWYPYPLYPERGGLLIWGGTYDGHSLCWLTEGSPDDWPIIVWHQRDSTYARYDDGAVAFITDWLRRTLPVETLASPPRITPWFEPARDLHEVYVYLDGGAGNFQNRSLLLREIFGPVQDRGARMGGTHADDHFATAQNWRVTYSEWPAGRLIRIAFPADDESTARSAVYDAIPKLGHTLRHAQTSRGTPVWA